MPKKKAPAVRLRLAPSPTGEVHIGTLWLAQFNYLYAQQHGGAFVLRIEDTDQKRLVAGSADRVYEALDWLEVRPDEGPREGGEYGPYIQSQRLDTYRQVAERLVDNGHAYHCFCTPERLDQLRAAQTAAKQPPRYDRHCAALSPDDVSERLNNGETSTIRLKVPTQGTVTLDDIIRGSVTFRWDQIDDSVILKSDGWPTYHLAVVVDDHLMEISHVFRAEEWLPSTPKHLFLYQALKWEPPKFAHFPLILGADRSKLSKRHGATSALSYRDQGFLPEAMSNFLVLMGWHPKGESEVLSRVEAIKQFAITDVNPSGAVFDQAKLEWLNGYYIRQLSDKELLTRLDPWWRLPNQWQKNKPWKLRVLQLVKDRLKTLSQIQDLTGYLVPEHWDQQIAELKSLDLVATKNGTLGQAAGALDWLMQQLQTINDMTDASQLKQTVLAAIHQAGYKNSDILWPGRVALSLQSASPDIFDLISVLRKTETLRRLHIVRERLG